MEKSKNVKTLRLTFPKISPYEKTHDFVTSKVLLHKLQIPPIRIDSCPQTPNMQLIAANHKLDKTKQILEEKKQFAKSCRAKLDQQWKELKEKENELKDTFVKMSHFVQSNEEKRRRAKTRCKEDHQLYVQRVKEIEKLKDVTESTENVKKDLEHNIELLKTYEKFLNHVVGVSNEFKNPEEVITRYETLLETRSFLGAKQNKALEELELFRNKTKRLAEENNLVTIGYNTILANLRARYTLALRDAVHWEVVVNSIRDQMYKRHKEITEVKQSCWNLYILMCQRRGELPKIDRNDLEGQLIFIKEMLKGLTTLTTREGSSCM